LPQCLDDGHHFHAIVGGHGLAPGNLFSMLVIFQNSAVTAGPGVPTAGPIGKNFHYFLPILGYHFLLHSLNRLEFGLWYKNGIIAV
jgi:hypothetical protein